jgi:preprotein translocase subunit Sss1
MAKKKAEPTKRDYITEFIRLSGLVMTKVGVVGFIVICFIAYIFFFVPKDQKRELTDTWLLFKCEHCNNTYISLFITLAFVFFAQWYFYHKAIKLKDQRIKAISEEKKQLQEILISKNLNSTR